MFLAPWDLKTHQSPRVDGTHTQTLDVTGLAGVDIDIWYDAVLDIRWVKFAENQHHYQQSVGKKLMKLSPVWTEHIVCKEVR